MIVSSVASVNYNRENTFSQNARLAGNKTGRIEKLTNQEIVQEAVERSKTNGRRKIGSKIDIIA